MEETVRQLELLIPALRRYARTLVRDPVAADDLVQDCLERAIARRSQLRSDKQVRSWVFAILHNLAASHMRRMQRRGPGVRIEDVPEAALSLSQNQEHAVELRQLLASVDALPDEQRSVILLVAVEDFSYADAARILGVPIGTLMSRLSRARARLRGEGRPLSFVEPAPHRLRSVK